MKIPDIFIPEKKLDNKVEELMKEKPLQKPQVNKNEVPSYAVQENGDYLVMRGGILINTSDCKMIASATFYFTINSEEHELHIGGKAAKLDGRVVEVKESLISKFFEIGVKASNEPDIDVPSYYDYWKSKMKHATEEAYKELVKLVNNA